LENTENVRISKLIFVPAVITLVITLLRLYGELHHWPAPWVNSSAGGPFALVGIVWLPIIFGPYFGMKLARAGNGPTGAGKTIGFAILGFLLTFGGTYIAFAPRDIFPGSRLLGLLIMAGAAALQFVPWPTLAKTLLAYGYAARIPVAIVMYFAIRGSWGTHYDALPPQYNGPTSFWGEYIYIGLIPQLIFWVVFTVVVGLLFAGIVAAIAHWSKPAAQPAA